MHKSPESFRPSHVDEQELHFPIEVRPCDEVLPITPECLTRMYSSSEFQDAIHAAWRRVIKTKGQEFGFTVIKDTVSDRVWISKPVGGKFEMTTDLETSQKELVIAARRELGRPPFIFLNLHFHSEAAPDYVVIPSSRGDLRESAFDRENNARLTGWNLPPIEMIAADTHNNRLKILAFQEPLHYQPMSREAIREEIDETIDDLATRRDLTQEEVVEVLHHYRYKTVTVTLDEGRLREEEIRKLTSFAFRPRPIEEKGPS